MPGPTLTPSMVYLETSDGVIRGRRRHGPLARQLVEIARMSGAGRARVRLKSVVLSARVDGDRWAVVGHRRDVHHAASLATEKLAGLLRVKSA